MSKYVGFKVVNVAPRIHQLLQHSQPQQFAKIDEASQDSQASLEVPKLPTIDQEFSLAPRIHQQITKVDETSQDSQANREVPNLPTIDQVLYTPIRKKMGNGQIIEAERIQILLGKITKASWNS